MKSLIQRDKKRRRLYKKYELKRNKLKSVIYNELSSEEERQAAQNLLSKLPRSSSKTRIKNRCVVTGRSKSVYRYFKVSRIQLRNLALNGNISGYSKISW
jgi:small subunit ribosomal protein S14